MNDIEFVWDRKKAESNLRKHGVAFESACEARFSLIRSYASIGIEVAAGERREVVIGMTIDWRIHRVVYVSWKTQIRVVSARPVTTRERKTYENQ